MNVPENNLTLRIIQLQDVFSKNIISPKSFLFFILVIL